MVQERITDLLMATGREGMEELIKDLLCNRGFFESPGSTRFHSSFQGGLAEHSLRLFELLTQWNELFHPNSGGGRGQKALPVTDDTIAVATLLHDVCKIGAYIGTSTPYAWNRAQPKGHALLSLSRIAQFIELTALETMLIRFHMGIYGLTEFFKQEERQKGEFNLRGDPSKSKEERYGASLANAWYHNPLCKAMYFCDEIAAASESAGLRDGFAFSVSGVQA